MFNLTVLLFVGTYLLSGGEAAIAWSNPSGGDGACGTIAETSTAGALSLTLTSLSNGVQVDGSTAATIAAYNILSCLATPHAGVTLTIAVSGIVSLVSGFLRFENGNTVTFTVIATDNAAPVVTSIATCTVTLINVNSPPAFAMALAGVTTAETVASGTSLTTYTATDQNGHGITYTIAGGDPNGDFDVASGTGEVSVAASATLARTSVAIYLLVICATDNGTPVESGTGTLVVCVGTCNGVGSLTVGLLTLFLALVASFN